APRQNSCPIVPTTKPAKAKHRPELQIGMPSATTVPPSATPQIVGTRNDVLRFSMVDRRHANSGPMPVSSSMIRPIGTIHWLKNGAATVMRWPVMASLSVGNIVANSTKNALNNRIQLLYMNAASRESHE